MNLSDSRRGVALRLWACAVQITAFWPGAPSAVAEPTSESRDIIEEFCFVADDYPILVPVELGGQTYAFMVDTGAATTAYDVALEEHLGPKRQSGRVLAADHEVSTNLYMAPDARIGRLPLTSDWAVTVVDLKPMREAAKYKLMGVLGMDFLRHVVWRLDFDHERICFLSSVPADSGKPVPVSFDGRRPCVFPRIAGWGSTRLLVDTGHSTDESGLLEQPVFNALNRWRLLRSHGASQQTDLVMTRVAPTAAIPAMTLGLFKHEGLRFSAAKNMSALGLRYWARYIVTFDLPNGRLYLKPSDRFTSGVSDDLSGVFFVRADGELVIRSVKPRQPGEIAGLKIGDRLLKVGELDVNHARLQDVREKFCQEGTVRIMASRGGKHFTVRMYLARPNSSELDGANENLTRNGTQGGDRTDKSPETSDGTNAP